jgi:hypothetical protein
MGICEEPMLAIFSPSVVFNQDTRSDILLSKNYKLATHLLSVFFPSFLFVISFIFMRSPSDPPLSFGSAATMFLLLSIYSGLMYFIAGGFDWTREKLPVLRTILFWIMGDFIGSAYLYGVWFLIRMAMGRAFKIPLTISLGRLLAMTHTKEYPLQPATTGEEVCTHCGAPTEAGSHYTFIQARESSKSSQYKSGASGGTVLVTNIKYKDVTESEPSYVCNKCVVLEGGRRTVRILQNIALFLTGYFFISIPLKLLIGLEFFAYPLMVLFFDTLFMILYFIFFLRSKEDAPVGAYSDLSNNPYYGRDIQLNSQIHAGLMTEGEKIAIKVQKPSLKKLGVNTYFTHDEAKQLSPASR